MRIKCLTKANFIKWLKSKSPKTKVGISGDSCQCAIAKFLRQQDWGTPYINVAEDEIYVYANSSSLFKDRKVYKTPAWVKDFIHLFDRKSLSTDYNKPSVSSKQALKMMEEIG